MLRQSVLPFKLEATDESLTSHAGLVLFGEFLKSLNLKPGLIRRLADLGVERDIWPPPMSFPFS